MVHQEDGRNLSHLCHSWRVVTNKIFLTWKIINCTFQPGITSLLFNSYSLFSPFYLLSPLWTVADRAVLWAGAARELAELSVCKVFAAHLTFPEPCLLYSSSSSVMEFVNISCLSPYSSRGIRAGHDICHHPPVMREMRGKHLPVSQVQERLIAPFVSMDSSWDRQKNIPGSPSLHCTWAWYIRKI